MVCQCCGSLCTCAGSRVAVPSSLTATLSVGSTSSTLCDNSLPGFVNGTYVLQLVSGTTYRYLLQAGLFAVDITFSGCASESTVELTYTYCSVNQLCFSFIGGSAYFNNLSVCSLLSGQRSSFSGSICGNPLSRTCNLSTFQNVCHGFSATIAFS